MTRPALALAAFALAAGCIDVPRDPKVNYGDEPSYAPVEPPSLELGFYVEQLYVPLHEGDGCPIIYGLQGGRWTMPALRAKGVDLQVTLSCWLLTRDGETLGRLDGPERLVVAPDGFAEIQALAIPVQHAPPRQGEPIDDVFGKEADLACQVVDKAGRTANHGVRVVLRQG